MNNRSFPISGRGLVFFTFARILLNTMYRMVYPFLGVFRSALGVSLEQMSIILTLRAVLGTLAPLLASIGDSRGRKTGMIAGMTLFIGGCGVVLLHKTYAFFAIAIVLTMLGKYLFDPSLLAFIGDKVNYASRGRVMALMELGWSLSFLIGVPFAGLLIDRFGWTAPFTVFALLGGVLLIGLITKITPDQTPTKTPGEQHSFLVVLTSGLALNGLSIGLAISAANEVINLIFGVWLEDTFQLKIAALGATTAVIGISELLGEFSVAALVDKLGKPKTVALGILLNTLAALGLSQGQGSALAAVLGLFFFYITFEFTLVSSIPLISEILPEKRATMLSSSGAAHSLGRAFGALLAAPLYRIGLFANLAVAVGFNLLALVALYALTQRKSL
ncbi:MAG: hypothetical protein DDG59_02550 [Anaerolineae bacterium]|jgi:predicted MFS family arabinose efflux permease|nr:MAG: hypothetical protein DDG59_02550 [Anaerolineae bacterium]